MDWRRSDDSAERFSAYLGELASVIGHAARVGPLRAYCSGLLLACARKSVEPIAAATAPHATSAQHQSLLHFLAKGEWSDAKVLGKVRELVLPQIERHGPIEAWIIDDTSFPKCMGRTRLASRTNIAASLASRRIARLPFRCRLPIMRRAFPSPIGCIFPRAGRATKSAARKPASPRQSQFQTKPKIALQQIEWACAAGIPRGVVLMDCAYGSDLSLRRRLTALSLAYAVGVWARTLVRTAKADDAPITAADLANSLSKRAWRTIAWRDGSNARLISRFARVRVRAAGEGTTDEDPEEWLIIEWPKGEKEPAKFWLSTLPEDIDFARMIDIVMMRWRIERDYQDLKQEVGLGHFEGRSWRGFHHHATMCIAAYGFLVAERGAFSPSAPRSRYLIEKPTLPQGYRPRGSPAPA